MKEIANTFCPSSSEEWRKWLRANHRSFESIWLIMYKKDSGKPVITWSEAVDEALCFGWIDSTRRPIDQDKFMQFFCRRKPISNWSRINKDKVTRLIEIGKMTQAGLDSIEIAKKNGCWNKMDHVEDMVIPTDLLKAFKSHKGSLVYFNGLSKSVKKMMLYWIAQAKRPETRQKRILEIASQAGEQKRPKQFT